MTLRGVVVLLSWGHEEFEWCVGLEREVKPPTFKSPLISPLARSKRYAYRLYSTTSWLKKLFGSSSRRIGSGRVPLCGGIILTKLNYDRLFLSKLLRLDLGTTIMLPASSMMAGPSQPRLGLRTSRPSSLPLPPSHTAVLGPSTNTIRSITLHSGHQMSF
jgi:hypothetical protein